MEAGRLVKVGQEASMTTRALGIRKQTLSNWVRRAEKGEIRASVRAVSAEQMELARLRAQLARLRMERNTLKLRLHLGCRENLALAHSSSARE